jgi:Tfp pilus assembly protein PilO
MTWRRRFQNERTIRPLRIARNGLGGLCLLTLLLGAFGFWSSKRSIASEETRTQQMQQQTENLRNSLREKRTQAEKTKRVKLLPLEAGNAEMTREVSRIAASAGITVYSLRFQQAAPASGQAPAPGSPPAEPLETGAGSSTPPPSAVEEKETKKITFECVLNGEFRHISAFLKQFATTPQIIEITTLSIGRLEGEKIENRVLVSLKITGSLFGTSTKP